MKESYWGILVLAFGIISILLVYFFQTLTNINEHNYTLLKETTEAAMIDALDLATYRRTGEVRIDQEKFVENFVRRFANNAQLSKDYKIEIYDVNEQPPKVSIKISSSADTNITGEIMHFSIQNRLDAILEEPHNSPYQTGTKPTDVSWSDSSLVVVGDEGGTDIIDMSDDSYLVSDQCQLSLSSDKVAYVGKSSETGVINVKNCGTVVCDTSDHSIAGCNVTADNKLIITGKKAGAVTVKIRGNETTFGNKRYRSNVIEEQFVVRILKESLVSFNPSSETVRSASVKEVPVITENCGNLICNQGCTVINNNKVRVVPSVGVKKVKVTCPGYYDPATLTQYSSKSAEYTLTYYKQDKSTISASDHETLSTNTISFKPSVTHCGTLSCSADNGATCTVSNNDTINVTPKNAGYTSVTAKCSGETVDYVEYAPSAASFSVAYRVPADSSIILSPKSEISIGNSNAINITPTLSHCGTLTCTGAGCAVTRVGSSYILTVTPTTYGETKVTFSCSGERTSFYEYRPSSATFTLKYYKKADSSISLSSTSGEVTTDKSFNITATPNNCNITNCSGTNATCSNNNNVLTIRPTKLGTGTVTVTCTGIRDDANYIQYNNSSIKYALAYYGTGTASLTLSKGSDIVTAIPAVSIVTATTANCGTLTCSSCQSIAGPNSNGVYKVHFLANNYGRNDITVNCSGTVKDNIKYNEISRGFTLYYYKSQDSSVTLNSTGSTVKNKNEIKVTATTTNCNNLSCSGNNIAGCTVSGNTIKITPKNYGETNLTVTCRGITDTTSNIKYNDSTASYNLKYLKEEPATLSLNAPTTTVTSTNKVTVTASTANCGTFSCTNCSDKSGPNSSGQYTFTITPTNEGANTASATCSGTTTSTTEYTQVTKSITITYKKAKCPDNIEPTYDASRGGYICIRNATPYTDTCKTQSCSTSYDFCGYKVVNQSAIDSCKNSCSNTYSSCTDNCNSTKNSCTNSVPNCDNTWACNVNSSQAHQLCDNCKQNANTALATCFGNALLCVGSCYTPYLSCDNSCPAEDERYVCEGPHESCSCVSGTSYTCGGWSWYSGYDSDMKCYTTASV